MSASNCICTVILQVTLLCFHSIANCGDEMRDSSVDAIMRLDRQQRDALLIGAISTRLLFVQNVEYSARETITINEYSDGQVGDVIEELNGHSVTHWRLGNSYRMDIERGSNVNVVANQWDSQKGVGTTLRIQGMADSSQMEKYARISGEQDRLIEFNRYSYWLDGQDSPVGDFLFRHLLERSGEWIVAPSEKDGMICVTVPWGLDELKKNGLRKYHLSCLHDFMPLAVSASWQESSNSWRLEELAVEEVKLVAGTWIPIRIREVIASSSMRDENKVNVHNIVVNSIEQGVVAAEDLVVRIPEGTTVVDTISMKTFMVGNSGEMEDVKPVYLSHGGNPSAGIDPSRATATVQRPNARSDGRMWLFIADATLIAIVGVAVAIR